MKVTSETGPNRRADSHKARDCHVVLKEKADVQSVTQMK